jgi:low affinity Fe/Cu permease
MESHDEAAGRRLGLVLFWIYVALYAGFMAHAALVTQIVAATLVTILLLRWQERAALGRNRAVR